jgi:NAD-dependent dihydropyrimidine dehydrogenase PreA subunit
MSMSDPSTCDAVLLCRCGISNALPETHVEAAVALLREAPVPRMVVADLCGLACAARGLCAEGDKARLLEGFLSQARRPLVLGCEPLAMGSLLRWAGIEAPSETHYLGLRQAHVLDTLRQVGREWQERPEPEGSRTEPPPCHGTEFFHPATGVPWIPWFPVIDRGQCIDCGKCHDFCLFGVYGRTGSRVEVANPANCKNNCPACARVCPAGAIIFAKFSKPPINGGKTEPVESGEEPAVAELLATKKARRRRLFSDGFESRL